MLHRQVQKGVINKSKWTIFSTSFAVVLSCGQKVSAETEVGELEDKSVHHLRWSHRGISSVLGCHEAVLVDTTLQHRCCWQSLCRGSCSSFQERGLESLVQWITTLLGRSTLGCWIVSDWQSNLWSWRNFVFSSWTNDSALYPPYCASGFIVVFIFRLAEGVYSCLSWDSGKMVFATLGSCFPR